MFVAAMMMFAQPAISGKWADTPSGLDVQIIAASIVEGTPENFVVFILGYNFDNGAEPIVKLANTPCALYDVPPPEPPVQQPISLGEHQGKTLWLLIVECEWPFPEFSLPLPFPNFLLTVQTGPSVHQFDTFNLLVPEGLNLNLGDFDYSLLQ
jgi:hypothetical protein